MNPVERRFGTVGRIAELPAVDEVRGQSAGGQVDPGTKSGSSNSWRYSISSTGVPASRLTACVPHKPGSRAPALAFSHLAAVRSLTLIHRSWLAQVRIRYSKVSEVLLWTRTSRRGSNGSPSSRGSPSESCSSSRSSHWEISNSSLPRRSLSWRILPTL